jgi:uncharacterized protein (TIGR02246 family)
MLRLAYIISIVIFLFAAKTGIAQEPERDIRQLLAEMEHFFSQGDVKGLVACWTADGVFANQNGDRFEGRSNIEKALQASFSARKKSVMKFHLLSLRILNEGAAVVELIPEVKLHSTTSAGELDLNMVMVKRDGRWWIESAREVRYVVPAQVQHLKDLEWLVGDWVAETTAQNGVSFRSSCDWAHNRAFLIRKFTVEAKDKVLHAGTEVIGWDPRARRVRSWVFDSNGGFGENLWVQDGNRWLIKYSGTLPEGDEISATNIITKVDADTLKIESKDRSANGERHPDVPQITLKRQPMAKDAPKTEERQKPAAQILP